MAETCSFHCANINHSRVCGMSVPSSIREYILGPSLTFHHRKNILSTLYAQLSNPRFLNLIVVVSVVSFISLVVRVIRLKKQTGLLPFIMGGILIYSGYCLERSFRVGVLMDVKTSEWKDMIGINSMRSSYVKEKILYLLKQPDGKSGEKADEKQDNKEKNEKMSTAGVMDGLSKDLPAINKEDAAINRDKSSSGAEHDKKHDMKEKNILKKKDENIESVNGKNDQTEAQKAESNHEEDNIAIKKQGKMDSNSLAGLASSDEDITKNSKPKVDETMLNMHAEVPDSSTARSDEDNAMYGHEVFHKNKTSYNDTFEQQAFTISLRQIMLLKEATVNRTRALLASLKKTRKYIAEDMRLFEENFDNFLKISKPANDILSNADISAELYRIDLDELKKDVKERIEIVNILDEVVKIIRGSSGYSSSMASNFVEATDLNMKNSNIHDHIALASKKSENLAATQPPISVLHNDLKQSALLDNLFYESLQKTDRNKPGKNSTYTKGPSQKESKTQFDLQETENLVKIQIFMIIQGLICLTIFIFMICNLLDIIPLFKLILLVILIGNVFIGIVSMIYAQALAKKCLLMDVPYCHKKNLFDVEEIVDLLNEQQETNKRDAITFIERKFEENYNQMDIIVDKLQKYMEGSDSRIIHKIDVFRNMLNKLLFIETQFPQPNKLYVPVYAMKRFLEDLQQQLSEISYPALFPIYRNFLECKFFFEREKGNVKIRVDNFLKLNMKRKEDKANDECKKRIRKICKAKKDYEELAFALICFGMIFVVLVCF